MKVVFSPHDDSDFLILAIWKLDVLPFPVAIKPTNINNLVIGYNQSGGSNTSDCKQL